MPSPHLQLSKLRWLVAFLMLGAYASVLLMPGTLGFGLSFAFEQVRGGSPALLECTEAFFLSHSESRALHAEKAGSVLQEKVSTCTMHLVLLDQKKG